MMRKESKGFAPATFDYSDSCMPRVLLVEVDWQLRDRALVTIGDEIDSTYCGFHTESQLREFAAWLIGIADKVKDKDGE